MKSSKPVYLRAYREGRIQRLNHELRSLLSHCTLCPQSCGVDRLKNEKGICETGSLAKVSSFSPHFGEEPPLVGTNGSGTIFFTHCNLLCNFCQNYDISHEGYGKEVDEKVLAAMMIDLQMTGCHNINFVTPSHVVPQIIAGLELAIENGLNVPLVFNTSAFDKVETLQMLEGVVDIYMPDFKFLDKKSASDTCLADDYPTVAKESILEMHRQVGTLQLDERGIAKRGLLIRHLVMPGTTEDSRNIIRFIAKELSPETFVNIMPQYRPAGRAHETPQFNRSLYQEEYDEVVQYAKEEGLVNLL